MTHTTPTGHKVHLHPVHYLTMRPEDVAEQALFLALAEAGRNSETKSRVDMSLESVRLHMANRAVREQAI